MSFSLLMVLLVSVLSFAGTQGVPELNTLTAGEVAEGWILLWDGQTTFGWEPAVRSEWKSAEGSLSLASGGFTWLRHKTPFADFVLKVDFRMKAAEADSGIFIRAALDGDPTRTGYQININDMNPDYGTGSVVNRFKAAPGTGKVGPGGWHSYEVTAEGDHLVVVLDGRKTVDTHDSSSRAGFIGLQFIKGEEVEFRNVKLRPLGLQPIFNGADLTGWERVDRKDAKEPPVWSVKGGAIHVEKGPGQLETSSQFTDFVLQLDVRANAPDENHHPNSGVFWRGDKGAFWSGYEAQIRNEFKAGDRTQPVDFGTGGIYGRQASRRVVSSDNHFFTETIVASGRHMATWVNGIQVTSFFDDLPADGTGARRQARLGAGPISLQAHDPTTNLDFRRIRIAELPGK